MNRARTRRQFLRLLAAPPLLAAGGDFAWAAKVEGAAPNTALIERLIGEARALPHISERIDFISRKMLGIRYQANTLIGSPKSAEKFVVRDDAFDCVTYCEVVLAAAMARDMPEFENALRRIRYDHGAVQYDQRNHYFADWCKRNIENGICRPVAIEPSIVIDKTVTWHSEFGKHPVSFVAITRETLLANAKLLAPGDIIGFASRRAGLDFYHTGLVAFGKTGELLMRNASQSRGRVVEDKMAAFVSVNPVKYVTVLRAADNPPAAERR
jgi:N-acetylmuramoyl-L-alanine amidase-like protein